MARAITVHAGNPLNQTALATTQSNLYAFGLFNEVNTTVVNPTGNAPQKTVLLQATEARRWTLNYGFGFEAQTGQPQNNCPGTYAAGVACNPNGKTGVSPRVYAGVTRNDLFGREQSASLRAAYSLVEQSVGISLFISLVPSQPAPNVALEVVQRKAALLEHSVELLVRVRCLDLRQLGVHVFVACRQV